MFLVAFVCLFYSLLVVSNITQNIVDRCDGVQGGERDMSKFWWRSRPPC